MTQAGIYVHIPFCRSRCSYCDFATGLYQTELAARYVELVVKEIETTNLTKSVLDVDTIYFGGGTPSMLTPLQLQKILQAIRTRFGVDESAEVTLEMNPGTISPEILQEFRSRGVNRASFGAQTFDDAELARLGRSHTVADTFKTFSDLRLAGFDNVSFDLIAGLPGQSIERWRCNVEEALRLRPEHLSFYLLEVHAGTPLAEHIRRGLQPVPDEDLAAEMYAWMLERAEVAGYQHYEISNLSLPGFTSRHNIKYWTGAPYLGFGCSAHSYDGHGRRWANERAIEKYMRAIETGGSPVVQEQHLTDTDIRSEAIFLGMRLMRGVDTKCYQDSFGIDLRESHKGELNRFIDAGLVEFDGDIVRLTRAGALMSNEVFTAFI